MKLYALCDKETLLKQKVSIEKFIENAKEYGTEIIQYRNKSGNLREIEDDLKEIRKVYNGTLILNDHLRFSELVDGFHIGQEDLKRYGSIESVRKLIGRKILGLSTHNREEIEVSNTLDLDYIGLGAYRNTSTKSVTNILGDDVEPLAKISKHPVAVIGGVSLNDKFKNIEYIVVGSGLL
jgi:thiamine-phosphate pyrophosphorylase